nr:hypothetical protein Itr_chr02CG13720 [Ipomoea trifida]
MKRRQLTGRLTFYEEFPMEIPMALTGGAFEGFKAAVFASRHKLAAAVGGGATHGGCMVLQALHVLNIIISIVGFNYLHEHEALPVADSNGFLFCWLIMKDVSEQP